MADKLTTQEENGNKVFSVEMGPGDEVTLATANTYVDKDIKIKANVYTSGNGINVDNDNYTISIDDSVVTVSKLADGTLQAIDLDPKSSHVVAQAIMATESFIGPAMSLYTIKDDGTLDTTNYGSFGIQTEGLDYPIVGLTANTDDARLVLGSYQERPYYFVMDGEGEFDEIALLSDVNTVSGTLDTHIADKNNPHEVTKAQVGLGNVENHGQTNARTQNSSDYFTSGGAYTLETDVKKYTDDQIKALPSPMVYKGTLGTNGTIQALPAATEDNTGHTYKVITDGTYAGHAAKLGDVFISTGTVWDFIPSGDEPSGTVVNVATGTGLTGGPITVDGTISLNDASIASLALADTSLQPADKTELEGKITAEETRATKAEETLQANINNEATARETKDQEIDGKLDTLTEKVDDLYHMLNKDVVPGTVYFKDQPISKLYCGTTEPASDLGNDGDLYIKY